MKPKKKVSPKIKKLIRDLIRRHAWNIGVSEYVGDIYYMEDDKDQVYAECTVDRGYLKAIFTIYPRTLNEYKKNGNEWLSGIIAHEVAHIATAHMYELATGAYKTVEEMKDAWESLTERIGRMSGKIKD